MNIDAQPPGNQHVSVWQQCGGVAVTRGVEAAGKREASGGSKGLDGRAPEQYGNAQARQYNRASHFVALNASATHRISMVLEWAKLFWAEQHGVLRAAYIGGVADDLAGVVDSDGVCKGEAGAGGNQRIEIDQATITVDERNVLAWLGRVVLSLRKVCSAHDLAVHIDSLRQVRISPGDRAQVRPDPIAVPGRVGRGAGAKVKGARDLTVVIDSEGANSRRTGGYRELRYLAVGVDEGTSSARYQKITAHYLARIIDGHSARNRLPILLAQQAFTAEMDIDDWLNLGRAFPVLNAVLNLEHRWHWLQFHAVWRQRNKKPWQWAGPAAD